MDVSALTTVTIPLPPAQGTGEIYNRHAALVGLAITNTHATVALSADFIDGATSGGALLVPIRLAVGAAQTAAFGDSAPEFRGGIYLVLNAGTLEGCIVVAQIP